MVDRIPIKQNGAQSNSLRTCRTTYNYNLQCSSVKYQVCAKMFADTFGVSSRTIGDIESLATVQSHYCRAKHKDRKFVEPGTTL